MICHSTLQSRNCVPVWCCSAHTHLIDSAINDALRTVPGYLRPEPADNLLILILAGIQPAEFRRNGATLSPAHRPIEPRHLFHSALACPSSGNARHLKPRHPFIPPAQQFLSSFDENNNAISRLQTGVGRFRSCLHKWSMATSANCECGAENQTVDHAQSIDFPMDCTN